MPIVFILTAPLCLTFANQIVHVEPLTAIAHPVKPHSEMLIAGGLVLIQLMISFSDSAKYPRFSFLYLPKVLYINPIRGIIRYSFFSLSRFGMRPFRWLPWGNRTTLSPDSA